MNDTACVAFLRWALPRLRMRWSGFRKVRRQVCKRIARRLRALGLPDVDAYRALLEADAAEWKHLDALCTIPISRFWRDRSVFDRLREEVLPALAERALASGAPAVHAWSAGCASGEEPYSLAILWRLDLAARFPALRLDVIATDVDERLLARARAGLYGTSSLKDLPPAWIDAAFTRRGPRHAIGDLLRAGIDFRRQDLREGMPEGPFHLVLCRNVAFTYFDEPLQREILARMAARIVPGGALVIGIHESLPPAAEDFAPWIPRAGIYLRATDQRPRAGRARRAAASGRRITAPPPPAPSPGDR